MYLSNLFHAQNVGVNQTNYDKNTALMISIVKRNTKLFDLLLPFSMATLNERNANYHSALHLCCIDEGFVAVTETDKNNECDNTAQSKLSLHMVAALLSQETIQLGVLDIEGKSPLHLACQTGNYAVAKLVLQAYKTKYDKTADIGLYLNHPVATVIDTKDEQFKQLQSEIHEQDASFMVEVKATGGCCSSLLDKLYVNTVVPTLRASWIITGTKSAQAQKGKKKQITEKQFETFADYSRVPLHLAYLNGHIDIVELLLQEDAINANAVDLNGNNCAHFAALSGKMIFFSEIFFDTIKYLCLDTDNSGNTILHKASISGGETLINFLVKTFQTESLLTAVNKNEETVLHTAARAGNLEAVRRFVSFYHLNVHARLKHDKYTPLHLATAHNSDRVMAFLLQHGADANAKTKNTVTPLRMAIKNCKSKQDAISKLSILIQYDANVLIKKATNDQARHILQYVADFPSVDEANADPEAFEAIKKQKHVPFCLILLLKFLDHPHLFLNLHFDAILFRLHETSRGPELVGRLVILSLALKQAIATHPLEELYLKRRFDAVERMLVNVMESPIMDDFQEFVYMMCLNPFQCRPTLPPDLNIFFKRQDKSHLHCTADAKILIYSVGPLSLSIDFELSALCGALQVASLTSASFWDHIRESCNHTLLEYFSMKSIKYSQNLDIRSRPAFMFLLEFVSNAFTLLLAAAVCIRLYNEDEYHPENFETMGFANPEGVLLVMILTHFLYEIGECQDSNYNFALYFGMACQCTCVTSFYFTYRLVTIHCYKNY